jgi:hypothetical protein
MARPEHLFRIAQQKLIRDGAELEAEIGDKAPGWFWTIAHRFRAAAAESMCALAYIDPNDCRAIEALQADIKVYDRFVEEVRAFIAEGIAADEKMTGDARDELLDIILSRPDGHQEAIDLGLIDPGPNDA